MRYAVLFGVVLAFAALAYLGLVSGGTDLWFTLPKDPGWLDGHLWWVAVTAGAGVVVGVLRRVFRLPTKLAGTVQELKDQRVEPSTALQGVAVSLVSLVGGASLGPEARTGDVGRGPRNLGVGATGSRRRHAGNQHAHGISASYGGLLSSPILATILVLELARPKAGRVMDTLVARCCRRRSRLPSSFRSRGRRSSGSTHCRPSSTKTGSCWRPCRSGSSRSARADHRPGDRDPDTAHCPSP